jgi:Uridine kinase
VFIIGITGGSGSGKSTLVEVLEKSSPKELQVLSQDRYYHHQDHLTPEQRRRTNYDHPDAFDYPLLIAHLRGLKAGDSVDVPVYDFVRETRKQETETIHPSKTLILEGILLMNNDIIFNLVDLWIYVDTDQDHRLLRRIRRDTTERGHDLETAFSRYTKQVKPMHDTYVSKARKMAHLVINNNNDYSVAASFYLWLLNSWVHEGFKEN